MWHDIWDPSHSTLTFQLKHEHYWCKRGPLVARITADKTGKVFMTGYIEEFTNILGGGTRLGKGRKKGRRSRKITAQSRLHSQGGWGCHSCHRKTWSRALSHLCSSLWTLGVALAPQPLPLETAAPVMLVTPPRFSTQCVFLLLLLHPAGRAEVRYPFSAKKRGK